MPVDHTSIYEHLLSIEQYSDRNDVPNLERIVRGVQALGFESVRMYLVSGDRRNFNCIAHSSASGHSEDHDSSVANPLYGQPFLGDWDLHLRNVEEEEQTPLEKLVVRERATEWILFPLALRGYLMGLIVADNSGQLIDEEKLRFLPVFASQATVVIANGNRLPSLEDESPGLSELVNAEAALSDSLDVADVLSSPCRAAVEMLKVDHCGMVLFDATHDTGYVVAEYPPIGVKGLTVPLRGFPDADQLDTVKGPITVHISEAESFRPAREILQQYQLQCTLVVPIYQMDRLIGSLGLDMVDHSHNFTDEQLSLCMLIARDAALAIESAELYERNKRREEQLNALQSTTVALRSSKDLNQILNEITRKVVELLGARDGGVYQYIPGRDELTVIADYRYPKTIGTTLKVGEGLSGKLVEQKHLSILSTSDYHHCPYRSAVFAGAERFGAVLGISLKWQDRILGVLYINDKAGREFPSTTANLPQPVNLLVSTAAIAIHNAQLLHEAEVVRERIEASKESSKAHTFLPDSARLLQDIAKRALAAGGASWVRLVKFEETGKQNFLASSDGRWVDPDDHIRPNGISMEVFNSNEPYVIQDTRIERRELNPALLASKSRAAVCLTFGHAEKKNGVIWIHYDAPREFLEEDLRALTSYIEQAAVAYESALQMEELGALRVVADQIAAAVGTEEVLERIAKGALNILQASAAAVWQYADNKVPYELSLQNAVVAGLDKDQLTGTVLKTFPISEATKQVMTNGWIGIGDISSADPALFSDSGRGILQQVGAKSLQGLALRVGNEDVGILYAVNEKESTYAPEDIRRARTFAAHAAMALKAARLVDDVNRTQLTVPEMAQLAVLGGLRDTLRAVVDKLMEVLSCNVVTLFVYNEALDKLEPYTTMAGVWHKMDDTHCENAPRDSIVYQMLMQDDAYKVPLVANNDLFKDKPFAQRENIQAVCAIPLKFRDERVGVLFVNYREPHTWSRNEDRTITWFADQAAVAIRNARLFEDKDKQLKELEALAELAKRLLGAGKLQNILKLAVDDAAESLAADFVGIVLPDETGRLQIKETCGWDEADIEAYHKAAGAGGKFQTDYTIEVGGPVVVLNYDHETRFKTPEIVKAKGIKSGLSVPMFRGDEKVGAMLVHSRFPRIFTEAEAQRLSVIANVTAIAIKQLKTLEDKIELMSAVQRASDEISRIRLGVSQKEVLDKLAEEAARVLPQAYLVTIELIRQPQEMPLDAAERKRELIKLAEPDLGPYAYLAPELDVTRFESVHPEEMRSDLTKRMLRQQAAELKEQSKVQMKVQEKLSLLDAGGKLGIAKRAIRLKKPQNVPDVSKDPDYLNLTDRTKSELAVPMLLDDDTPIGVINVESETLTAFDESDVQALRTLAKLAVNVTQNAAQYKQLQQTKELVESSTLLAWFGMASSMWGHAIEGHAINISNNIMLLRRIFDSNHVSGQLREQTETKLRLIERMAEQIRDTPATALLSYDEGVSNIDINTLIRTRMSQLWLNDAYKRIPYNPQLEPTNPFVRGNRDWIMRLLEILIDNAVEAMSETKDPQLTIQTEIVEEGVEITVTDNGPGIPPQIRSKLFKERIEKQEGAKGLGIALLIVQAVARVYKGQSKLRETGPKGTTMSVWLPLAENQ